MKLAQGQVAVVTGGASGIGFGLAEEFAARGLRIVLSDIRKDALREAQARLESVGASCVSVVADVADPEQVDALATETLKSFGRADIMCNNAGIVCKMGPMWKQTHRTWQWLTDVALLGVVSGVRAFAPIFLEQGTGHFVNTASVGGLITLPYLTPYNAVKHAVVGMTESLNIELRSANNNVGASVLCPGLVRTSLGESSAEIRPKGAEVTVSTGQPRTMDDAAGEHGSILDPRDVAVDVVDAIEADRVHIFPAGAGADGIRHRIESVIADIPPTAK